MCSICPPPSLCPKETYQNEYGLNAVARLLHANILVIQNIFAVYKNTRNISLKPAAYLSHMFIYFGTAIISSAEGAINVH